MSAMNDLLKALRQSVDRGEVTMSQLARTAGCTRQHLYAVFSDKHKLSLDMAEKLAAVVGYEFVIKRKKKKLSA